MKPNEYYRSWRYKNTTFLALSLIILFFASDLLVVQDLVQRITVLGFFGAFIMGILFTSIFTVAPATIVLYLIAQQTNPWLVALFGGLGAMLGDYLIFRFLKDRLFDEIGPILNRLGGSELRRLLHTPYFAWLLPIVGAIIIASPLPDELGITLLGLSTIKNWQLLLISFMLNSLGILLIAGLARVQI